MKDKIFSKEIIGLPVETIKGHTIGILSDLVLDCDNGSIKYLLIETNGAVISNTQKVDDKGRMVVETERIRIESGKIIIN